MLGQIVSRAAFEMSYFVRSSNLKDIITEKECTFELGVGDGVDIPIYCLCKSCIHAKRSIKSTPSK